MYVYTTIDFSFANIFHVQTFYVASRINKINKYLKFD